MYSSDVLFSWGDATAVNVQRNRRDTARQSVRKTTGLVMILFDLLQMTTECKYSTGRAAGKETIV